MKQHRLFGLLLAVVVLPFLVSGILVATKIAMWVTGTSADERSFSFLVAALCLVPAGILLGGLLAYGIIVFFLSWFKPLHPLLTFADIESGLGRYLNPAFRAVHTFAIWLAPKRR
jgi:flagellar biosynthesis protein FliQ